MTLSDGTEVTFRDKESLVGEDKRKLDLITTRDGGNLRHELVSKIAEIGRLFITEVKNGEEAKKVSERWLDELPIFDYQAVENELAEYCEILLVGAGRKKAIE